MTLRSLYGYPMVTLFKQSEKPEDQRRQVVVPGCWAVLTSKDGQVCHNSSKKCELPPKSTIDAPVQCGLDWGDAHDRGAKPHFLGQSRSTTTSRHPHHAKYSFPCTLAMQTLLMLHQKKSISNLIPRCESASRVGWHKGKKRHPCRGLDSNSGLSDQEGTPNLLMRNREIPSSTNYVKHEKLGWIGE